MSTIQQFDELIARRKGKVIAINPRIESINKRTTRTVKDEENFITEVGEFRFSDDKPVKAGIPYHIHYTSMLEEFYMTEYEHKPKMSKIIYPNSIKTNFQYYNILNKQQPLKLKGERIEPTDEDYLNTGRMTFRADGVGANNDIDGKIEFDIGTGNNKTF